MSDELKIQITPVVDDSKKTEFATQLQNMVNSFRGEQMPQVALRIDRDKTAKNFETQLNSIVSGLRVGGVKLNLDNVRKELGQFKSVEIKSHVAPIKDTAFNSIKQDVAEIGKLYKEREKLNPFSDSSSIDLINNRISELQQKLFSIAKITEAIPWLSGDSTSNPFAGVMDANQFGETLKNLLTDQKQIDNLTSQWEVTLRKIDSIRFGSLVDLKKTFESFKPDGEFSKKISGYTAKVEAFGSSPDSQLISEYDALKTKVTEIQTLFAQNASNDGWFESNYESVAKLIAEVNTLETSLKQTLQSLTPAKTNERVFQKTKNEILDLQVATEKYINANDRLMKDQNLLRSFESFKRALDAAATSENITEAQAKNLREEFNRLKIATKSAGLEGQSFTSKLSTQMEKLGVYFSAAAMMMGAVKQLKEMIRTVVDLDSAMVDLQVATGKTRNETKELLLTYSELGQKIGATTKDVASAADGWLRQNKTLAETEKLVVDSMMLSKLGKMDSEESTKALTSAMKGYKVEVADATQIVDKFVSVDMDAAVSAGYIATAMAETATSARLAGVDINRLTGYLTAVGEATQDGAESVGTFYKTLFARMGNIKEGKLVDPETQEDLSSVEVTLGNLDIKLRDSGGVFRNFGTVLDDVSQKWEGLNSVNQRAIAVAFAGYRVA